MNPLQRMPDSGGIERRLPLFPPRFRSGQHAFMDASEVRLDRPALAQSDPRGAVPVPSPSSPPPSWQPHFSQLYKTTQTPRKKKPDHANLRSKSWQSSRAGQAGIGLCHSQALRGKVAHSSVNHWLGRTREGSRRRPQLQSKRNFTTVVGDVSRYFAERGPGPSTAVREENMVNRHFSFAETARPAGTMATSRPMATEALFRTKRSTVNVKGGFFTVHEGPLPLFKDGVRLF